MLRLYPDVPFEAVSTDYAVSAEGKSLRVRTARVSAMPVNQIFRGTQRPLDETEIASFVSFESDGAVSMTAVVNFDVFRACVVPASRHIAVTRKGRALSFTPDERLHRQRIRLGRDGERRAARRDARASRAG